MDKRHTAELTTWGSQKLLKVNMSRIEFWVSPKAFSSHSPPQLSYRKPYASSNTSDSPRHHHVFSLSHTSDPTYTINFTWFPPPLRPGPGHHPSHQEHRQYGGLAPCPLLCPLQSTLGTAPRVMLGQQKSEQGTPPSKSTIAIYTLRSKGKGLTMTHVWHHTPGPPLGDPLLLLLLLSDMPSFLLPSFWSASTTF